MPDAPTSHAVMKTTWGPIRLVAREGRLASCELPFLKQRPSVPLRAESVVERSRSSADRIALQRGIRFVKAALFGRAAALPALEESHAPFFKRCRAVMQSLNAGKTIGYAELARRAGSPGAVRAAGQACARNPLPLFVPCHRILGAGNRLGGFSCGLPWKEYLLEIEAGR